ncbi:hypothetical protein BCR34DRAFT_592913 [Clohesyomyces aquaticus]|uniref:SAP domain-containing protein n=1 Tax=Clohesyomyces aquaticus TaxID=1231657 RepID=A0A1Y1YP94_9PLEO|nr:hypothetical protein BCR34DRAFT_592913 [Clohesyomyces aquaticus]
MSSRVLRSSSAQPSRAPARSVSVRLARARSLQPTAANSTTEIQMIMDIVQNGSTAAVILPTIPQAPGPEAKTAAAKKIPVDGEKRSVWGDKQASTETKLMNEHAAVLLGAGIVDEATANKLRQPWHEKGVLGLNWDTKYLDPSVKDQAPMMDLAVAKKAAAKKDVDEKKMLAEYQAGKIDAWGNPIAAVAQDEATLVEDTTASTQSSTDEEDAEPTAAPPARHQVPAKGKDKVASGRVAKSKKPAKKNRLSTVVEVNEVDSSAAAANPATASAPTQAAPSGSTPKYDSIPYYQLIELGRQRGLVTGGNRAIVIARLKQDDINVATGAPREMAAYRKPGAKQSRSRISKKLENAKAGKSQGSKKGQKKDQKKDQKKGQKKAGKKTESAKEDSASPGPEQNSKKRKADADDDEDAEVWKPTTKKHKVDVEDDEATSEPETNSKKRKADNDDNGDAPVGQAAQRKMKPMPNRLTAQKD